MTSLKNSPVPIYGNRKFFVYVHRRETDGSIFYVGKGSGRRHKRTDNRRTRWKAEAEKFGWIPEILYKNLTEQCAFSMEKMLISALGDGLVNLTKGGEGFSGTTFDKDAKEKMCRARRAQWSNPEAIERRRQQTIEQWQRPGMREKLKAAAKARWERPGQKEMVRKFHTGRKQSEETKAKRRGVKRDFTPEHRAALKAAWVIRRAKNEGK